MKDEGEDEEEDEESPAEIIDEEYDLGLFVKEELIPYAIEYYLGVIKYDEEDYEDEEDEDDSDEDDRPKKRGRGPKLI